MVVAVSKALEAGARSIVCASTGNTSASAAAYGAAAGLEVVVVLPKGRIATGKLLQALVAGARVVAIDGNFDAALRIVRELAERTDHPVTLVNSVNPHRLEGQKTAAFEVCDDLGRAARRPGHPGRERRQHQRLLGRLPRLPRRPGRSTGCPGCTASRRPGAAPIVLGHPVAEPETIATAIRIGDPASWSKAIAARDESGGRIEAVTDDEILEAYRDVARDEGVFCEPSSAAGLAGRPATGGRGPSRAAVRGHDRLRPDRQRPQGPDDRRVPGRRVHRCGGDDRGGRDRPRLVGRCATSNWLAELDGRRMAVEVPATTANLGAGYDCLGLALDLTNRVELEVRSWSGGRIELEVDGEGVRRAQRGPRQPLRPRSRGGPRRAARSAPRRRRLADRDAQPDPAGPWPRLVGRRHRGRDRGRRRRSPARACRPAGCSSWRPRSRATRTTPPPRCSAGSS